MIEPKSIQQLRQAKEWLTAWEGIDGGVTIDASGKLHPWRFTSDKDLKDWGRRCGLAEAAEKLLTELVSNPELYGTIRVILSSTSRTQVARALKDMKL